MLTAVAGVEDENELAEAQTIEVSLPPAISMLVPEGEDVSVAVAVFDETTLFPVREEPTDQPPQDGEVRLMTVVGSQVVSIQVAGLEDGTPLQEPLRLLLSLNQIENMNDSVVINPVCVFWDFDFVGKYVTISQNDHNYHFHTFI